MAKTMKGITCIERNGSVYWYARIDGQRVYCGQGDKGKKLAEAGRAKNVCALLQGAAVNPKQFLPRASYTSGISSTVISATATSASGRNTSRNSKAAEHPPQPRQIKIKR